MYYGQLENSQQITLRVNILRLKIGTIDNMAKITNLVSVIKDQKYYFESEGILYCITCK